MEVNIFIRVRFVQSVRFLREAHSSVHYLDTIVCEF